MLRLSSILRRTVAWAVVGGVVAVALSIVIDGALVLRSGGSLRQALAAGCAGGALGIVLALVGAFPMALLETAVTVATRRARVLGLIPVGVVALAVASTITFAPWRPLEWARSGAIVLFSLGLVFCAAVGRAPRRWWTVALALALGAAALAVDVVLDPVQSDYHDLLGLLQIGAALSVTKPLRARVRQAATGTLVAAFTGLVLFAVAAPVVAGRVAPGWRLRSTRVARMQPRLARACRAMTDFDGDGFSALFWGGDCDDGDPRRNPRRIEQPNGIDANCNGTVRPAHPTAADVGLLPPAGDPNAPPGTVDRFILLTIDCWRLDAFGDETTPNLARLARHGLTMRRMVTSGTRTVTSVRFIQSIKADEAPVAEVLAQAGVPSTAVLPGYVILEVPGMVAGYSRAVIAPAGTRLDADETTARVLDELHRSPAPRLLWAHYLDAHQPIGGRSVLGVPPPLLQPGMPGEYLDAVRHIDQAIGHLLEVLAAEGSLGHTAILVTADHGESFGAHGVEYHGREAYEELVHVPAIFVAPGLEPGQVEGVVSQRDIPPTLLGAFGLVPPDGSAERFGRSWWRLLAAPAQPLHAFAVTYSVASRVGDVHVVSMAAITEPRFKQTATFENDLTELFDLQGDPQETHDLTALLVPEAARLKHELALFRDIDGFE